MIEEKILDFHGLGNIKEEFLTTRFFSLFD